MEINKKLCIFNAVNIVCWKRISITIDFVCVCVCFSRPTEWGDITDNNNNEKETKKNDFSIFHFGFIALILLLKMCRRKKKNILVVRTYIFIYIYCHSLSVKAVRCVQYICSTLSTHMNAYLSFNTNIQNSHTKNYFDLYFSCISLLLFVFVFGFSYRNSQPNPK